MKSQALGRMALGWGAGLASLLLSSCLGMQSQSTLDGIQGATHPYVEAFIEYAGPHAKWAGPSNFMLHVVAKDAGAAKITVTPALFRDALPPAGMSKDRAPASQGVPGEHARQRLAHMATSLQGADQTFKGCLSPLRVRLIRADGAVLEKQGCRGQSGWAKGASEAVSHFISASLYGLPAETRPAARVVGESTVNRR